MPKTTRTFKELCNGDPTISIKTLIDGLLDPDRISWLRLDFDSFADADDDTCYGCGATFALL